MSWQPSSLSLYLTKLENILYLIGPLVQRPVHMLSVWFVCKVAWRLEVIFSVQTCSQPCGGEKQWCGIESFLKASE